MESINAGVEPRNDGHDHSLRSNKAVVVFFALISVITGLITVECVRSWAGGELPAREWGIVMVIVTTLAALTARSHFHRREGLVPSDRGHATDARGERENIAQRALLEQFRTPEFPISGKPKTDAAALSHYLQEMNCELVKSVSGPIHDRPQERKLLGD